MMATWLSLETHDAKGAKLVALETQKVIPFEIRRVYFIDQPDPSIVHGRHAHKSGETVLVCLRGSCRVTLDDGRHKSEFLLDRADRALHVGPLVWEEFTLSADGLLLVLADAPYDRGSYIEDYDAFLTMTQCDA